MTLTVRPLTPSDFPQVRPMLLDLGFVEDEVRFPAFCASPDWALLGAFRDAVMRGDAAAQDDGPHLRSGNSHRTVKLHDLYTAPEVRGQGVGRTLMLGMEAWAQARGARYLFWYANLREATPAYERMGYTPGTEVQEGYRFFEVDFSERTARQPHPERGS